ncbi:MAG: exopolysaccharide biosynthesis polyprenyl glycosylphosphotransferase [Anaerolineae bacterium]|nr:exopolysaccharide biosynthesis polyprenyl glycosylphosphotransferase [Anaerolineae bacterium]
MGTRRLPALQVEAEVKRRRSNFWVVLPLFLLDAVCIALSLAAAYQLRFRLMRYYGPLSEAFYNRLAWIAIPMWLGIFALYRLYHPDRLFGGMREYTTVVNACTTGLVGLILYSFLDRNVELDISRGWLAIVWLLSVITVSLTRFGYRRLVYYLRRRGLFIRRALVVGVNEEGQAVVSQLRGSPEAGVEVVGFVDPALPLGMTVEGLRVLGKPSRLRSLVRRLRVEELIIIPTAMRREELLNIYRDWGTDKRVRVCLSSGLYELCTTGAQVREVGFIPLLSLNRTRITGVDALMKAAMDFVGAVVAVVLLAPVFLIISILVRRDSPGSVIYRRRVVGLYGRRFDAYKFRTMIPDAEAYLETHAELKEQWDSTGKIQEDPRITRVGRLLRRFSLDELPQLLNVLKGQMSLVGPRMITPEELRHFGRWRHNLLTVKPGLTGLWQVSGRSDLSYEDRVRLDMHYIRNYTVWTDLKLVFNTIWTVLRGRGAY